MSQQPMLSNYVIYIVVYCMVACAAVARCQLVTWYQSSRLERNVLPSPRSPSHQPETVGALRASTTTARPTQREHTAL